MSKFSLCRGAVVQEFTGSRQGSGRVSIEDVELLNANREMMEKKKMEMKREEEERRRKEEEERRRREEEERGRRETS